MEPSTRNPLLATGFTTLSPSQSRIDFSRDSTFGPSSRSAENISSTTASTGLMTAPMSTQCCFCFIPLQDRDDELRAHLLKHLEKFGGKSICPECGVNCASSSSAFSSNAHRSMVDHFMMVHGRVEKLVCGFNNCVGSFWTREELGRHEGSHSSLY